MISVRRKIDWLLVSLVALDATLALVAFCFPQLWFDFFHGTAFDDPQGLLRRSGGNWAAFALFQLIARLKWRGDKLWLVIVAGIRLSDIFTDWAYLFFCSDITLTGGICLFFAPLANLLFAHLLMKYFRTQPE